MLNKIGLKHITNSIKKEKELPNEIKELKDIEEKKLETRNKKLIEYFKLKKENNTDNDDLDDLLMHYLDDDLKMRIEEELTNKFT